MMVIEKHVAYCLLPVLDPRLKLQYYQRHQWNEWVAKMEKRVATVYEFYSQRAGGARARVECTALEVDTLIGDVEQDFDLHVFGHAPTTTSSELNEYLAEPIRPTSTDPLVWWSSAEKQFPTLAAMAKDYLAVPGRIFTTFVIAA